MKQRISEDSELGGLELGGFTVYIGTIFLVIVALATP